MKCFYFLNCAFSITRFSDHFKFRMTRNKGYDRTTDYFVVIHYQDFNRSHSAI